MKFVTYYLLDLLQNFFVHLTVSYFWSFHFAVYRDAIFRVWEPAKWSPLQEACEQVTKAACAGDFGNRLVRNLTYTMRNKVVCQALIPRNLGCEKNIIKALSR